MSEDAGIEPRSEHIQYMEWFYHREYRGPSFLSIARNVAPPPLDPRGETHSLAGEAGGGGEGYPFR
jgi:hypothetical protein